MVPPGTGIEMQQLELGTMCQGNGTQCLAHVGSGGRRSSTGTIGSVFSDVELVKGLEDNASLCHGSEV